MVGDHMTEPPSPAAPLQLRRTTQTLPLPTLSFSFSVFFTAVTLTAQSPYFFYKNEIYVGIPTISTAPFRVADEVSAVVCGAQLCRRRLCRFRGGGVGGGGFNRFLRLFINSGSILGFCLKFCVVLVGSRDQDGAIKGSRLWDQGIKGLRQFRLC
ncbi:hypothetical protein KSS87_018476 [Heliosperma pusillum]|nr:hypothetical protein KSS87_018476 [Heliosperma pusillum]